VGHRLAGLHAHGAAPSGRNDRREGRRGRAGAPGRDRRYHSPCLSPGGAPLPEPRIRQGAGQVRSRMAFPNR
jgi:hypothetical protein